jgi:hypothetical protein
MPELKDMTGLRFDRLTVTRHAGTYRHGGAVWLCTCECGEQKVVCGASLRRGLVRSCGCLRRETSAACARQHLNLGSGPQCINYRHGHASQHKTLRRSPEYRCWDAMKDRCSRPAAGEYHRYGGRGIEVCERWRNSFEAFLADMGQKPTPQHSIDRINNDGNYEPDNCRWATAKEQANNRRPPNRAHARGKADGVIDWSNRNIP